MDLCIVEMGQPLVCRSSCMSEVCLDDETKNAPVKKEKAQPLCSSKLNDSCLDLCVAQGGNPLACKQECTVQSCKPSKNDDSIATEYACEQAQTACMLDCALEGNDRRVCARNCAYCFEDEPFAGQVTFNNPI